MDVGCLIVVANTQSRYATFQKRNWFIFDKDGKPGRHVPSTHPCRVFRRAKSISLAMTDLDRCTMILP